MFMNENAVKFNLLKGCLHKTKKGVPIAKTLREIILYFKRHGKTLHCETIRKLLDNNINISKWGFISKVSRGLTTYYYIEHRYDYKKYAEKWTDFNKSSKRC